LGLLATFQIYFIVSRLKVSHVLDFNSNQMREGGR
jgi:hypothetical protein